MKRTRFLQTVPALVLVLLVMVPGALASEMFVWSGSLLLDNRFNIEGEESAWTYNETTLELVMQAFPTYGVTLRAELQFEGIGVDENLDEDREISIAEQQGRVYVDPIRIELGEAYMAITGLGLDNLDMKFGKQRIQWGTGDQFNPTDVLNPDDFHDPLEFGKKIPTLAFQFNYYAGPVTLTAIGLPLFQPTLLPTVDERPIAEIMFDEMASQFTIDTGSADLDTTIDLFFTSALQTARLGDIDIVSKLPERTLANTGGAFKVAVNLGDINFSASYAYVFEDFGVPRRIEISTIPFSGDTGNLVDEVDLRIVQEFPRLHVIGADFATAIPGIDVGFWGEIALFMPEPFKTEYFLDAGEMFNGLLGAIAQKDADDGLVIATDEDLEEDYIKAVAGIDYTFPGAVFINLQYIRGLPSDNTASLQEDYIFGGVDKAFLNDTILMRVFAGYTVGDNSTVVYPQLFFYPRDSLEFHVGVFLVFGDLDTKLGAFGDSIAFLQAKMSF